MGDYSFYTGILKFVVQRTERDSEEIDSFMGDLEHIVNSLDEAGRFVVPAGRIRTSARALAGVAGFLQRHILPEVVAAGNKAGEAQVRWSIDKSMEMTAALTVHAETIGEEADYPITLPPPPESLQ